MFLLGSNSVRFIFTFVSVLLLSYTRDIRAQGYLIFNQFPCSTSGNYTSSSQFETNLNLLLSSLVTNGSQNGYFNASIGSSPDTAYGLVQCRGDLSMQDCQTCLNAASVEILQSCPNRKNATLQYDQCVLRYSDTLFLSIVDTNPRSEFSGNVPDADLFNQQLSGLMLNLSSNAASRLTRYNSGSTNYTNGTEIYGVVQCTRDLAPRSCFDCLNSMITEIPVCCNARQGAKVFSRTCYLRYELYPFVSEASPPPPVQLSPPPPVQVSPPQTTVNGKSTNVAAIVVPVIASVFLLAIFAYFIHKRMLTKKKKTRAENNYDQDDIGSDASLQFDLDVIRTATDNFSDANKLGEGGFGAVYKGKLLDGQEVAVKRLSKNSGQGSLEFRNEVVLLHKLQHRNLVRLLGFCLGGEEKILIYEFVPNRSLDKYIFDPIKKSALDWPMRYKIIRGIARGVLYLHEDSRLRIIHRDLKSGNVLLDEEMNAKIADFGMAKLFGVDQTQGETNRIAGTYGYMAPEYALHGLFSVKSDVYSFGILILEMISGQKTNNFTRLGPLRDLLGITWKLWKEGNALQLMDPILLESYTAGEVMRCIHIGLLCVQDNLEDRPTMSSIVLMLSSSSLTLQSPSAPAFILETTTGKFDFGLFDGSADSMSNSLLYSVDNISNVR